MNWLRNSWISKVVVSLTIVFSVLSLTAPQEAQASNYEQMRTYINQNMGLSGIDSLPGQDTHTEQKVNYDDACNPTGPLPFAFWRPRCLLFEAGPFLIRVVGNILRIIGLMFDIGINISIYAGKVFFAHPGIEAGWTTARDVANMFFIFVLLYIAIGTTLQLPGLNVRQAIIKLIVAAMLINFSGTITKLVIDASNILAVYFYEQAKTNSDGSANDTLDLRIVNAIGLVKVTGLVTPPGGNDFWYREPSEAKLDQLRESHDVNDTVFGMYAAIIFMIVIGFVLFAGAFIFFYRFIVLLLLFILSPFAFLFFAVPGSGIFQRWWQKLIDQGLFAPAYMVMLMISLNIFDIGSPSGLEEGKPPMIADIVMFIIACAMLFSSLLVASHLGAAGADRAVAFGRRVGGAVRGAPGRLARYTGRQGYRGLKYAGAKGYQGGKWAAKGAGRLALRGAGEVGVRTAGAIAGKVGGSVRDGKVGGFLKNQEAKGMDQGGIRGEIRQRMAGAAINVGDKLRNKEFSALGATRKSADARDKAKADKIRERVKRGSTPTERDFQNEANRIYTEQNNAHMQRQLAINPRALTQGKLTELPASKKQEIYQQLKQQAALKEKYTQEDVGGKTAAGKEITDTMVGKFKVEALQNAADRKAKLTDYVAKRAGGRFNYLDPSSEAYGKVHSELSNESLNDYKRLREKTEKAEKTMNKAKDDHGDDSKEYLDAKSDYEELRQQRDEARAAYQKDKAQQDAEANKSGANTPAGGAGAAGANLNATGAGVGTTADPRVVAAGQAALVDAAINPAAVSPQAGGAQEGSAPAGSSTASTVVSEGKTIENVQMDAEGGAYGVTADGRLVGYERNSDGSYDTNKGDYVMGFQSQAIKDRNQEAFAEAESTAQAAMGEFAKATEDLASSVADVSSTLEAAQVAEGTPPTAAAGGELPGDQKADQSDVIADPDADGSDNVIEVAANTSSGSDSRPAGSRDATLDATERDTAAGSFTEMERQIDDLSERIERAREDEVYSDRKTLERDRLIARKTAARDLRLDRSERGKFGELENEINTLAAGIKNGGHSGQQKALLEQQLESSRQKLRNLEGSNVNRNKS